MTSPNLVASTGKSDAIVGGTSGTVPLPAGLSDGSLCLIFLTGNNNASMTPSGQATWVSKSIGSSPNNEVRQQVWAGIIDAVDSGEDVTITRGSSGNTEVWLQVWEDWDGDVANVITGTAVEAANPGDYNPPSVDPSWTGDWTAVAVVSRDGDGSPFDSYPTNCPDNRDNVAQNTQAWAVASAETAADTFDPDAFGSAGTNDSVCQTVAIQGTAGGGSVTGTGTPVAQSSNTTGVAEREVPGTGVLTAQATVVAGSGTVLAAVQVLLTAANNRELRDNTEALVNLNNVEWEWYDDPDSTAGDPVDSGTVNIVSGEATINVLGSTLTDGQFGALKLRHPTDNTIRGDYYVPVTD